jgi:hypothetical protein
MTNAEIVVQVGERIWGPGAWLGGMSEFADINVRTLQRIYAAARAGEDYPAARGVVTALRERLTAVLAVL